MLDRNERVGQIAAHKSRRGVGNGILGEALLQVAKLADEQIEIVVGNGRGIFYAIPALVLGDNFAQIPNFILRGIFHK